MTAALLPPFRAEIQRVEAGDTRMLARALLALPPTPPLPDRLPEPPPAPGPVRARRRAPAPIT